MGIRHGFPGLLVSKKYVLPQTHLLPRKLLLKFRWVRLFDTEPTILQPILLVSNDGRPFVTCGRLDAIWFSENS